VSVLPSGLSAVVADGELVARFLMSSGWFSREKNRVKHQAFLPAPDHDTSVFRTTISGKLELWKKGEAYLNGRNFYGAAVIPASIVRANGLELVPMEPPPAHANLRGWPIVDSDPELQKARRKTIATAVSEDAVPWFRSADG
jgi:hypothetical protein